MCDADFESAAWKAGCTHVAGTDEVGRGALAGPVLAAAVILDPDAIPEGLDDSKLLSRHRREVLAERVRETALAWAVARVEADEIDRINILQASLKAMRLAVEALDPAADWVLVDGNRALPGCKPDQLTIVGGDHLSVSIAAASIVAKVTRDLLMREFDGLWPGYGFASHVGYGTLAHQEALRLIGPSPIHRRTFRGVLDPCLPLRDHLRTNDPGERVAQARRRVAITA